jgi:hypothetical protein
LPSTQYIFSAITSTMMIGPLVIMMMTMTMIIMLLHTHLAVGDFLAVDPLHLLTDTPTMIGPMMMMMMMRTRMMVASL